jgi:pimeloyl-ACP methyl ester carboxylesterase
VNQVVALSRLYEDKFEDKYVTANGLRLHYADWGGHGQPTLLLVHGLNVQLHTWDPIADLLRDEYHVLAVDLRGHGDSQWAADGYRLTSFLADIEAFADELRLGSFDLVGHSLGGLIGLAYGAKHPERLQHLAVCDCGPEVRKGALREVRQKIVGGALDVRGFKDEEEAEQFFRSQQPGWRDVFYELHARYQLRENWFGKLVWKADPELFWVIGSTDPEYIWQTCREVRMPTLLAWGDSSFLIDQPIIDKMLAAMPTARAHRFEAGHYMHREQPEEFATRIREFLRD